MSNDEPATEPSDEQPLDHIDPEVRAMIPDEWTYEEVEALCEECNGVYPVADRLGMSRAKGAFLLRKLGLLRYVDDSGRGGSS